MRYRQRHFYTFLHKQYKKEQQFEIVSNIYGYKTYIIKKLKMPINSPKCIKILLNYNIVFGKR